MADCSRNSGVPQEWGSPDAVALQPIGYLVERRFVYYAKHGGTSIVPNRRKELMLEYMG